MGIAQLMAVFAAIARLATQDNIDQAKGFYDRLKGFLVKEGVTDAEFDDVDRRATDEINSRTGGG